MGKRALLCFTLLVCTAAPICAVGRSSVVFPGERWQTATPESQGVDATKLCDALDYLCANSGGVGTDETVVIRHGYLIWQGPDANNVHEIYSCTKTFTSTVLGLLATDDVVSVDDYAVKHLPQFDDEYPQYAQIKLSHLATMTSGYNSIKGDGWALYRTARPKHHEYVLSFTTPGPPLFPAGTSFKYHDPAVHMLGYILTKTAGESLEDVFRKRVASRIGMRQFAWSHYGYREGVLFNNPAGTPGIHQGGASSSPLDLARYGWLYLNKGNWNGKQILSRHFAERATSTQVPAEMQTEYFDLTGRYGFFWWTNGIQADGKRPWPSAPPRTFAAQGAGRNFIFVVPEWNLVIVRLSPAPDGHVHIGGMKPGIWEEFFSRLKAGIDAGPDRTLPEGFLSLFNGINLDGWTVRDPKNDDWQVVEGVIDCDPHEGSGDRNLWTTRSCGDFELLVDWRIKESPYINWAAKVILPDGTYKRDESGKDVLIKVPNTDSGVFLRGRHKSQVNIWCWPVGSGEVWGYRTDPTFSAEVRAGVTPKVRADRPIGQWNTFHIIMTGDRLTVRLNGQLVLDNAYLPGIPAQGPIALQHHGDRKDGEWGASFLQFRRIFIKELNEATSH